MNFLMKILHNWVFICNTHNKKKIYFHFRECLNNSQKAQILFTKESENVIHFRLLWYIIRNESALWMNHCWSLIKIIYTTFCCDHYCTGICWVFSEQWILNENTNTIGLARLKWPAFSNALLSDLYNIFFYYRVTWVFMWLISLTSSIVRIELASTVFIEVCCNVIPLLFSKCRGQHGWLSSINVTASKCSGPMLLFCTKYSWDFFILKSLLFSLAWPSFLKQKGNNVFTDTYDVHTSGV